MEKEKKKALFERQYSELFDYLYRYVCYRISNRSDAEDLVSDCFTNAYEKIDEFDDLKGSLRQWLTGMAKNRLLMYWRSNKNQIILDIEGIDEEIYTTDRVSDKLELEKILESLDKDQKLLLVLKYIDGFTFDQIAEIVGKTPQALRQYISRLKKKLRLENEEYV